MVKQVIIVRKDLNMRKGKMIAQGAHASVNVIIELMEFREQLKPLNGKSPEVEALNEWLISGTRKIAVSVDSELELLKVYESAHILNIPCALISDAGHTEFHGKSTLTAVAIGPWDSEEIDKITGELKLL